MDRLVYVAMTGAKEIMERQSITANNLANLNTTGFRGDQMASRALPVFNLNLPTRVYAVTEGMRANFEQGAMQETGRSLDVAVKGPGWLVVQAQDGQEALTRNGNLQVSPGGMLQTADGHPVMGNNGPITLPPLQSVSMGADGTISGVPQGQPATANVVFDRIKLANPAEASLQKSEDGLFRSNAGPLQADAQVALAPGFLEGSNVNAVSAMVDMINLSRQFETQIKLIQTVQNDSRKAGDIMNLS